MSLGKASKGDLKKEAGPTHCEPNQIVYADMLVPGVNSDTPIGAVLVVMDAYLKFVAPFMLRTKAVDAVP